MANKAKAPAGKYNIQNMTVVVNNCSPELLEIIKKHTDDITISTPLDFDAVEKLLAENNITDRDSSITYEQICELAGVQPARGAARSLSIYSGRASTRLVRVFPEGKYAKYYARLTRD